MECEACGHQNREGARYCGGCGASLARDLVCGQCGHLNPGENRFCDGCGAQLSAPDAARPELPDHLAAKIRSDGVALEGERKLVTVLFADVIGSMELAERLDPEAWRAIMDRLFAILCAGVHRFEGTVDKFTGDGIMALFGAPIAHEDHAVRACYASLDLKRELATHADELRRKDGVNLSVRIGLNSGEVVVGAIGEDLALDYTAIGHTVGLAQRMESLAAPGCVYLTDHTAGLVEGFVALRDLGEFAVKGASAPLRVHELVGAASGRTRLDRSRARGFSRFVGRVDEMAVLEAALARADEGHGQVIGIVADAGVGKSRLCYEFAELAAAQGHAVYRAAAASHTRHLPFQAALSLMRAYFGIDLDDEPAGVRERVAGRLLLLEPRFADELPLLFDFLGVHDPERPVEHMDPEARARRLTDLVRHIVLVQSLHRPTVTLLEDLHWIDEASAGLLEEMISAVAGTHSLVLVNFRPEFSAPWMSRPHYQQIALAPLASEDARALLDGLLGGDPSLDGLGEELERRTGGNPFFAEEVVLGLAEDGTLLGEPGAYRLGRPLEAASVPASVQAVLAARIDRLTPGQKSLLQIASVIGREFGAGLLARASGRTRDDVAGDLRALVAADFVLEQELYPEPVYAFRHPLTQEVAYGSQLSERRSRAHGAVAQALIEIHAESLDEHAPLISHHLEAAAQPLEAARWRARAAAWSGLRDPGAALEHWRVVATLVEPLAEDAETRALGIAARTWMLQLGWRMGLPLEEAELLYAEGRAIAERAGDRPALVLLLTVYASQRGVAGELEVSEPLISEAFDLARDLDPQIRLAVGQFYAYHLFLEGAIDAVEAVNGELLALAREIGDAPGIATLSPLAWSYFQQSLTKAQRGDLGGAVEDADCSARVAQERGDLEGEAWALSARVFALYLLRDGESALIAARRSSELAERNGSSFTRAHAHFFLGLAHLAAGDQQAAIELMERALALSESSRTAMEGRPLQLGYLAEARLQAGDPAGAVRDGWAALDFAERHGISGTRLLATPALASALAALGDIDAARELIDGSLERARSFGLWMVEAELLATRAGVLRAAGEDAAADAAVRVAAERFTEIGMPTRASALLARAEPAP